MRFNPTDSTGSLMSEDTLPPTSGQLERRLSQGIQALYRNQLGHQPGKITCQIFDEKIAIILENSITKPEQILAQKGQEELAEVVRSELDQVLQVQLKELIEEILEVPVIDLLSNAKFETGRTGAIAILAEPPKIRDRTLTNKEKREQSATLDGDGS